MSEPVDGLRAKAAWMLIDDGRGGPVGVGRAGGGGWVVSIAIGLLPVVVHGVLFAMGVTLGSPRRIVYPYSPVAMLRFISACRAIGLVVPLALGVVLAGSGVARRRWTGLAMFAVSYAGLGVWAFGGNPLGMSEHQFNMISPSQDGAFLIEARRIDSLEAYLRSYPALTRRDSDALRGVRVLSNTPGTTVLAYGVGTLNRRSPRLFDWIERAAVGDEAGVDDPKREIAEGAFLAAVLTALWGSSIVFAYGLGRLRWGPATSLAVAAGCVFHPSGVLFTPGKDPAQLFTSLAMLFFWFRAYAGVGGVHRAEGGGRSSQDGGVRGEGSRPNARDLGGRAWVWGVSAGVAFVVAAMVGLIHIWVAVVALGVTVWHAGRSWDRQRRWIRSCGVPAVVGATAVTLGAYALWGWNIPGTALATARRYMEVQHDVLISPFHQNLIGGGVFLLFAGPMFWMLIAGVMGVSWSGRGADGGAAARSVPSAGGAEGGGEGCVRDDFHRLGRGLLVLTGAVMLYTYFFAQNAEVGRLWVVFIPLLVWPAALVVIGREDRTRRGLLLLLAVVACQIGGTMLQWSMMDARGAEGRILSGRYFAG